MKRFFKYSFAAVVFMSLLEVALRMAGFQVHRVVETKVSSHPNGAMIYHPYYGLALNPGRYDVTINDGLHYVANHEMDSARSTGSAVDKGLPLVYFYGCSFTYGMGVNDWETFPSLLQQQYPEWQFKNYAVPGYSTVHGLLQLQSAIEKDKLPQLVVLGYTSYQDARNQLSGIQQKYWSESLPLVNLDGKQDAHLPYVRKKNAGFEIDYLPFSAMQRRWALSRHLVFINRFENAMSHLIYGFTDKYKLTEWIMNEMNVICKAHHIKFIVVALDRSESAYKMEYYCAENNIDFLDATIDIQDAHFNLQPFDSHPNQVAHAHYARRLNNYLKASEFQLKENAQIE
jgi:hypothetical protein